jgi:hypothetical protein
MADSRDDAQAQAAKALRANDGKKSVPGYEAEAAAMRAKTEKLKALRLAREAELAASAPPPPVKRAKAAGGKAKKQPAGTLADWIKAREDSGHNN